MDSRYLELRTLKRLQEDPGSGGYYLLAVSGGVDSMVMLEVLSRLQKALNWQWSVVHVHHGDRAISAQLEFRAQAQELVRKAAHSKNYEFLTNAEGLQASFENASESEHNLRAFRYKCFEKWLAEKSATAVMLAHQAQDWLESQLIAMIRGGGASFQKEESFCRLRPLSDWSKDEILFYAKENKLSWIEDPSNEKTETLRNWLRQEWLPQLERYREGSVASLARSLDLLWNQSLDSNEILKDNRLWLSALEVSRLEFARLSSLDQRRVIAAMMNNGGLRNYTQTQIKEVLKRLDSDQKAHNFRVAKCTWSVGPVAFKIHVDSRPDGSSPV